MPFPDPDMLEEGHQLCPGPSGVSGIPGYWSSHVNGGERKGWSVDSGGHARFQDPSVLSIEGSVPCLHPAVEVKGFIVNLLTMVL